MMVVTGRSTRQGAAAIPLAAMPLVALLAAVLLTACGGGTPAVTVASATATPRAASPTATAGTPAPSPTPPPAASAVAALNGLRCQGQWRNQTFGSTGAFSARVEAAPGGGLITFEIGGNLFGGSGGVVQAPFRQAGNTLVIDTRSELLGQVQATIELGGKAAATMTGPPALGPNGKVTLTDYSYGSNGALRFALNIDFGGGRPPASSIVEAACAKA